MDGVEGSDRSGEPVPPDAPGPSGTSDSDAATRSSTPGLALATVGAVTGGLCVCFALPPCGWWPLAPVGIALFIAVLGGRPVGQRAALGWLVGVTWFGPSTLWMAQLTLPGYVVGVLVVWGGLMAGVAALTPGDRRRTVVLPALLVLFEWFHVHAPFGGIPLSLLATTQADGPLLAVARLGGFLLVGMAASALGAAMHLAATRRFRAAGIVLAAVAAIVAIGTAWPIGDPVDAVTVAAVQGGGPQGTRYSSAEAPVVFQRHLDATRSIEPDEGVDVIVWPENVVNVGHPFDGSPELAQMTLQAERLNAPIIAGIVESVDADRFVNYVVVVHPDGRVTDRYDKKRRVPFGEYVPMRWLFEPIAGAALPPRDQIPGDGTAVVRTGHGKMAVAISWEIFFGRRVREGVQAGGQVVLNPTNGSSYWLTQVQTQQVASSQLRAVESGRWVVQVAPTGFSAFVDPDGGVHDRTEVSEQKVIVATIDRLDATTPAQATGDLVAVLSALGALGWVAVASRRHRDTRLSGQEPGAHPGT